jgi:tetratricopeptide (TPR) repeat protein
LPGGAGAATLAGGGAGRLWLGLPTALPLILGDPRALQFRYAFVLPVYLTTIAGAMWAIAGRFGPLTSSTTARRSGQYAVWALATISLISTLDIYQQTKPNWREAAAYLSAHTQPADIILIGPLWDEGRFIGYYYQGQAPLLTPAALVTNIEGRAAGLRQGGGRIWAVNRFAPAESGAFRNLDFDGVTLSEPTVAVYEPALLAQAAIDLAAQAVEAAYPWAAAAQAQGVLDPDPRTARAGALRALGDALLAAGQPQAAVERYQTAVDIFPGWVDGFLALAEAQEAAGNLPAAAEAWRQAVAFKSDWRGDAADEAWRLAEAGQWAEAIARYKQITGN